MTLAAGTLEPFFPILGRTLGIFPFLGRNCWFLPVFLPVLATHSFLVFFLSFLPVPRKNVCFLPVFRKKPLFLQGEGASMLYLGIGLLPIFRSTPVFRFRVATNIAGIKETIII